MAPQHLLRALAAHRPAQAVGLARGKAGEGLGHFHHLILEDDRAQRVLQDRPQGGMLIGDLIGGVFAQPPAPLDIGVDRPALNRARPDDRDLDREVSQVGRPRASQRLHLGAALDLKDAHRVGGANRREGVRIVKRDPRQVDALPAHARDFLHAALHRREHAQAEQVDLQKARVRARVLVPLHHLPALHGGRHHRAAVDQRSRGDDHAARMLGEMARQPLRLCHQAREPTPAR